MSLESQLQAELGTAYTIDRELTGGGMSRVFVATEVALGRKVVVKVLHPELAAGVTAERFSREIQLAARLQQANIVPLLSAGTTGDLPFYTMPFVDGLSLRQRLVERSALPIGEAIGVLRDVARALAYAHDAGVVHRDIKPENILLSGGAAVVTDFGIAKAITVSRTQSNTTTLTQAGVGVGTPAYMAPEQAAGDPAVDHRADIYAFGCVAYELLTGQPAFRGRVHELISAHMTQTPAPVRSVRPGVPPVLAVLVERCLEKSPDRRPQHARELVEALETVATPAQFSIGAFSFLARRGIVLTAVITVSIALIAYLLATRLGTGAAATSERSIAVIPLVNVGGDSAQDYLADGVSDELATAVGKLPGVHLAARSAAYRFRGQRDVDVRKLGKTLQVNYVVQGTLRRLGDSLRISAQLTDAASGKELWAGTFDRTTKDVFRTQNEIRDSLSTALRIRSRTNAAPRAETQGTASTEAYDLYLRAEFDMQHRRVSQAVDMFEQAIARDTGFARAYAGLSQALDLMPYFEGTPFSAVEQRIMTAANHALARDSTLAEPHMALGLAYTLAWRWNESKTEFERAIAVDPNDLQSHFQFGRMLYYVGDDERALAEWQRARAIDPFFALASIWPAQLLAFTGRTAEGVAETGRAIAYDSSAAVILQLAARVYLAAGDTLKARAASDRTPDIPPWIGMKGYISAMTGDRATAMKILRLLESASPRPWFGNSSIGFMYLGLGDTSRALAAFERATDAHEIWPAYNRVRDPMFDPLRGSARWAALVRRVGLGAVPGAIR
jgi:serine/threonine-protein kinase